MTALPWEPMSPEEAALPAQMWPPEALDRLLHAVRACDGEEPVATPELDAIEELRSAINAAQAALIEPTMALELRRDDNLPATPEQRSAARTAVWQLRHAVARTLFTLAFEGAR